MPRLSRTAPWRMLPSCCAAHPPARSPGVSLTAWSCSSGLSLMGRGRCRARSDRSDAEGELMKVTVDPDRCQGHAQCWEICPEVFSLDEEGHSVVLVDEGEHLRSEEHTSELQSQSNLVCRL